MKRNINFKALLILLSLGCLSFTFIDPSLFGEKDASILNDPPNVGLQQEAARLTGTPTSTGAAYKTTTVSTVVTKALYFKSLLTTAQQSTLQQAYTASLAKKWSNLPCGSGCRNGIQFSTLTATQLAAALDVIQEAGGTASGDGSDEFRQIRFADAYLLANGGGSGYDSGIYFISYLNTPSVSGAWMLQYGGHHYAANIAFNGGNVIGVTPSFQGVEPTSFVANGTTYAPLTDEHDAFTAMLASLSSSQLATAKITGTTYSDVTLSPGETNGGSGTFPTTKVGQVCSTLTTAQKNLVLAAIQHYVQDYDATSAASLMTLYTNEINSTYIAWTGSGTAGSASTFLNANTNYVRIDGPSVWVEFICQTGVVFPSQIHYHTVYRDHARDYGNNLSNTSLPVNLVSFNVQGASTGNVLQWETGLEDEALEFVIERTGNPAADFEAIGTVKAKNSASSTYSFTDRAAQATGTLYYRLRCVAVTGDVRYSQVRAVKTSLPIAFSLAPNPAADRLTVALPGAATGATIQVVDLASGKSRLLGTFDVAASTVVDISGMASGTYLLVIENGTVRYASKFVKQ